MVSRIILAGVDRPSTPGNSVRPAVTLDRNVGCLLALLSLPFGLFFVFGDAWRNASILHHPHKPGFTPISDGNKVLEWTVTHRQVLEQ
jgi:hypothetical protein